jgi:hypothetical protein
MIAVGEVVFVLSLIWPDVICTLNALSSTLR